MESHDDRQFQNDSDWDSKYFELILELGDLNASRYESQTSQLLAKKSIEITVDDIKVRYWLNRTGCFYSFGNDNFSQKFWARLGWRNSSKRNALPSLFAKSEADLIYKTT